LTGSLRTDRAGGRGGQDRLIVWLTHTGRLHAHKVAEILGVSTQAVWLWIRQYNTHGPAGLERSGRGGRRWCYLTAKEEADILKPFLALTRAGKRPRPATLKPLIEKKLGRSVSMSYVYRLLARHNWADEIARSHRPQADSPPPGTFGTLSRPWLRQD